MKRAFVAAPALVFPLALAFALPMPGGAATPMSQSGTNAAQCGKVAQGYSKVNARVSSKDSALNRAHQPFGTGGQSGRETLTQACRGSTARKPSPPAAQVVLIGDLLAIKTAEKGATAYLTAAQANVARGRANYTQTQILATVKPVTNATTSALRRLTALIPSLPPNMASAARTLSSALSEALELYQVTAVSNQRDVGLPNAAGIDAADVKVLTSELRIDVTDEAGLITGPQHTYVLTLENDYSVSGWDRSPTSRSDPRWPYPSTPST